MPTPTDFATLRINGDRLGTVEELTDFLTSLQNAYNGLYAFNYIVETYSRQLYDKRFIGRFYELPPHLLWKNYPHININEMMEPENQLIISKINIQSPGFWEAVGALNPMQQIREFLNDRHERGKDKRWREATEREKAIYENELLQRKIMESDNKNFSDRIRMLKELGFSEKEVRELVWANVGKPLHELGKHQDTGLIKGAE